MSFPLLADAVVILHLGFVLFAVLGGLLVIRWRWVVWLHLPAATWAILLELGGWICPLTPLENWLRGSRHAYEGGFVERYLLPLLYPAEMTRGIQLTLAIGVLVVNLTVYGWVVHRWRRRQG
jgi:hypothetical protein